MMPTNPAKSISSAAQRREEPGGRTTDHARGICGGGIVFLGSPGEEHPARVDKPADPFTDAALDRIEPVVEKMSQSHAAILPPSG
jgi:hypothetical protein